MLINLPHSSFTVRQYTTVKEVRLHSERGKATVARVVGIVATMPCCDIGVTAPVMSTVRALCVGSFASIWWGVVWRPSPGGGGRARRNLHPRPRGSGEAVSASEPLGGRAWRNLRPRPVGVRRDGVCVRALGVKRAGFWARDWKSR